MTDNKENKIPSHIRGKKIDVTEQKTFKNETAALKAFERARTLLLDINNWQHFAGITSAVFELLDSSGKSVSRAPRKGDYVRIDIPGPGSIVGNGHDWVRVTELDDRPNEQYTLLKLQPSPTPKNFDDNDDVAHFLTAAASTNLELKVVGLTLHANYYGRNEETNVESDNPIEIARNVFVGLGVKFGFSYPQWKKLIHSLLGN